MIEICTVGGYNEVGKNMTAVKVDDEVVIFDMGVHLDSYIKYTEDEDLHDISAAELIKVGAIPDDSVISDWRKMVRAIIPTHAHLDHIGAVPFLSNKYDAPIICTPYSAEVLKALLKDEKLKLNNKIRVLSPNSTLKISETMKVEFINMTHSVPQTIMVALHTKYGTIIYANDFKLDDSPIMGKKPNYKRLRELGDQKVAVLIIDSIYASEHKKTPSESVAKEMLRDVLLSVDSKGKAVIVTTFSSHLARLKSIVEFGKRMNRKIVFLGRSLAKYIEAGENINLVNFSKEGKIFKYANEAKSGLRKIMKDGREKYLIVVTGHQGEPKSILSRMVGGTLPFDFKKEDHVVFSCTIIPTSVNFANREKIEGDLRKFGVRIFRDIHVSGHAAREDHRDLINLTRPEHLIPAHAELAKRSAMAELASEMGYAPSKVHLVKNGQRLKI